MTEVDVVVIGDDAVDTDKERKVESSTPPEGMYVDYVQLLVIGFKCVLLKRRALIQIRVIIVVVVCSIEVIVNVP
jgi:hypothetical protein